MTRLLNRLIVRWFHLYEPIAATPGADGLRRHIERATIRPRHEHEYLDGGRKSTEVRA